MLRMQEILRCHSLLQKGQTTSMLPSQRNVAGFACRSCFEGVAAHGSCGNSGSNAKFPAQEVAKGIKAIQDKFRKSGFCLAHLSTSFVLFVQCVSHQQHSIKSTVGLCSEVRSWKSERFWWTLAASVLQIIIYDADHITCACRDEDLDIVQYSKAILQVVFVHCSMPRKAMRAVCVFMHVHNLKSFCIAARNA